MADLADQIDDYICSFEGVGDLTIDMLAMLIFAWAVLALFLIWLCKLLYNKYILKNNTISGGGGTNSVAVDTSKIGTSPSEKLNAIGIRELSTSKDIKGLDLAAKPSSKFLNKGISGSGTIVKKRITRKSTGTDLATKPYRTVQPPTNIIGSETCNVQWINQVFRWLYSDLVITNELLYSWLQIINQYNKQCVEEHGVEVEIVRLLPESSPPNLTNIYCNNEENSISDVIITLDCDAMPLIQVKAFKHKNGKVDVSHYKVVISRLRARLIIKFSSNTLKGEMKIEGFPDIRITMNTIGTIKAVEQDEKQLQEIISDQLSVAIRQCIYPIDLSLYPTCPRDMNIDPTDSSLMNYPNSYDSFLMGNQETVSTNKRLLVKVVRGEGLINAVNAYCIVEMDEPSQKKQTSIRQGINPFWDEHFLFNLCNESAEILFEVYDQPVQTDKPHTFLGLGLVGVNELLAGPASSQILTLQPRPYETQPVHGAITVEFIFIDGVEMTGGARPMLSKTSKETAMTIHNMKNGVDIPDTLNSTSSLRLPLENGKSGTLKSQSNRSTLIIHSVQKPYDDQHSPTSPTSYNVSNNNETMISPMKQSDNHHVMNVLNENGTLELDQTKSRRKRDFFNTLKRLGRSKTRAKSVERIGGDGDGMRSELRSVSADRGVPAGKSLTGTRLTIPSLDQSRRSSLSESSAISGFSSTSTKTFIHEASTLVLETVENGVKKHFLVPLTIAQKPRWRRKGVKLHIYNDHTFVAKHLSGGLLCDVCNKSIPRRPGKQGYECRDCFAKCHKQCHIRIPQTCANPTVLSLELSKLNSAAADRSIRKL